MPMREDCKHFQSRTYPSGEVARFCVLTSRRKPRGVAPRIARRTSVVLRT